MISIKNGEMHINIYCTLSYHTCSLFSQTFQLEREQVLSNIECILYLFMYSSNGYGTEGAEASHTSENADSQYSTLSPAKCWTWSVCSTTIPYSPSIILLFIINCALLTVFLSSLLTGEFGEVYKARLIAWHGQGDPRIVAVKTLRGSFIKWTLVKVKSLLHSAFLA